MTRKALIVGADGFVGRRATTALEAAGFEVLGAGTVTPATQRRSRRLPFARIDIRDREAVRALVHQANPDFVLHLAAISHSPAATADPRTAYEVNVIGAVNVLDALGAMKAAGTADPMVVVVGSGEEYGIHPPEHPLRESDELRPVTPYAVTKIAQEVAARYVGRTTGLRVVCTRSFNHSGPGQASQFMIPTFVRQAIALSPIGGTLRTGNAGIVRDFLHVDDVVRAYLALGDRGRPGTVYNVCSGIGRSVREIAERILHVSGIRASIETDPAVVRPIDIPWLVGDPARIKADTGWAPRLGLDDIIAEMIGNIRSTRIA